jgi:hypothetical protein
LPITVIGDAVSSLKLPLQLRSNLGELRLPLQQLRSALDYLAHLSMNTLPAALI